VHAYHFLDKGCLGVSQLHDDPLVVTLVILNYLTHRILSNNNSSTDILYLLAFEQMGVG